MAATWAFLGETGSQGGSEKGAGCSALLRLRPRVPPSPPRAGRGVTCALGCGSLSATGRRGACAGARGRRRRVGSFRAAGWGLRCCPRQWPPAGRPPALRKGRAGPTAPRPLLWEKDKNAPSPLPSIIRSPCAAVTLQSLVSAHAHVLAGVFPEGTVAAGGLGGAAPGWPGGTLLGASPCRKPFSVFFLKWFACRK